MEISDSCDWLKLRAVDTRFFHKHKKTCKDVRIQSKFGKGKRQHCGVHRRFLIGPLGFFSFNEITGKDLGNQTEATYQDHPFLVKEVQRVLCALLVEWEILKAGKESKERKEKEKEGEQKR